jgi:hypothetical protein
MRRARTRELLVIFAVAASVALVDPRAMSDGELRHFRGDFVVSVPGVAPRCPEDPVTHIRCIGDDGVAARGLAAGMVFTAAIFNYPPEQRQQIYDAYTRGLGVNGQPRQYTHFPVHIPCVPGKRGYHGIFPPHDCSGTFVNGVLRELWNHDPPIVPVCFVMDDGASSVTLPEGFDRSLCRIVVPQWEHPTADCALAAARAAFPDALLYWENPANLDFPEGDACRPRAGDVGQWLQHARHAYGLTGLLLELDTPSDLAASKARTASMLKAWEGVDVVLFETDIYQKFWRGRSEADGVAYNDALLEVFPSLAGFASGGSRAR